MADVQLTLNSQQRSLLERILSTALKQKQVEVHRTEFSRDFRKELEGEEAQLRELLEQVSRNPA